MILLRQMIVFFILMAVGYLCRELGYLNDTASKSLSAIIVNITNPMMIISSAINAERIGDGKVLASALATAVIVHIFLILLSYFVPRLLRADQADYGIYRVMTIFSNLGFLGMPIVRSVYGDIAVLYAAIFTIPYNVLIYTYGIDEIRGRTGQGGLHPEAVKKILNVGVIAAVIGVAIYLGDVTVPSFLSESIDYLGDITAPLTMLVIGDSLARMDIRKLFTNRALLLFSAVKLLAVPLIGICVLRFMPLDSVLKGTSMILMAVPVGSMTAMFAQQYDSNYELASQGVALTTLLAVLTLPVISLIAGL